MILTHGQDEEGEDKISDCKMRHQELGVSGSLLLPSSIDTKKDGRVPGAGQKEDDPDDHDLGKVMLIKKETMSSEKILPKTLII